MKTRRCQNTCPVSWYLKKVDQEEAKCPKIGQDVSIMKVTSSCVEGGLRGIKAPTASTVTFRTRSGEDLIYNSQKIMGGRGGRRPSAREAGVPPAGTSVGARSAALR